MSKRSKTMYRQCHLERQQPFSKQLYVTYLPLEFAIEGKIVKLKFESGWEDGWKVIKAGPAREEALVEAFVENGRRGFPSVSGHSKENA